MTQDNQSTSGSLREDQAQLMFDQGFSFSGYERDVLFLALPGRKYLDISGCSGIDDAGDGRASVFADFDNDGDTDVFLTTIQGDAHLLFRNNVGQDGRWLRVALEGGTPHGRDAFGAVARIREGGRTLTKIKSGGMGYVSQHDPRLLFGLGDARSAEAIEVTWPGGSLEAFPGPFAAGSSVLLREGAGRARELAVRATRLPDPLSRDARLLRGLRIAKGRPFPEVAVTGSDGRTVALGALRRSGRRTLVNLWATWCAPCLKEMPELQALFVRLSGAGVDLLGLNLDTEAGADVAGFARRSGAAYPIYRGGLKAVEAIYATDELVVPLSVLLDEKGLVEEVIEGWSERTRNRFEAIADPRSKGGR